MTHGIHHVTAIAGPARRNFDFYTRTLGLRFVKKTVNFDDPGTYHFYYGDETGATRHDPDLLSVGARRPRAARRRRNPGNDVPRAGARDRLLDAPLHREGRGARAHREALRRDCSVLQGSGRHAARAGRRGRRRKASRPGPAATCLPNKRFAASTASACCSPSRPDRRDPDRRASASPRPAAKAQPCASERQTRNRRHRRHPYRAGISPRAHGRRARCITSRSARPTTQPRRRW